MIDEMLTAERASTSLAPGATSDIAADHVQKVIAALQALDLAAIQSVVSALESARAEGVTIFTLGNGGSATTATHFACDLAKGTSAHGQRRMRAMAINDNLALLTAWSNDVDYSSVYAEILKNFVRVRDVVVAISTSGNSSNVLRAAELARKRGATLIAFTGQSGGALRGLADIWCPVTTNDAGEAEDVHLAICHAVTAALRLSCQDDSQLGHARVSKDAPLVSGCMDDIDPVSMVARRED